VKIIAVSQLPAISAAKLEYFTKEHTAWAHLMLPVSLLAMMNLQSKHATAYGVHLLTKFIENL
jgi:leucyl aminopeptidase